MYVIVVGGGNVGIHLTKRLLQSEHEVLLLEKDPSQATKVGRQVGETNVMNGDGCEMQIQKEAGFTRADVIVAVTGEDEDNLVVCQMAKTVWNVERVLARVNDPEHEEVFKQIGIDETVSATSIIYSLLEQQISPDTLLPVGALGRGNIEVVEVELSSRSPVTGKKVRELDLPPGTNFVWLLREGAGHGVDGDTVLKQGDTVVALVRRDRADELRHLLAAMKP